MVWLHKCHNKLKEGKFSLAQRFALSESEDFFSGSGDFTRGKIVWSIFPLIKIAYYSVVFRLRGDTTLGPSHLDPAFLDPANGTQLFGPSCHLDPATIWTQTFEPSHLDPVAIWTQLPIGPSYYLDPAAIWTQLPFGPSYHLVWM